MRSDSKPQITLDDWLAAATRGLCADAKARIQDEIEAHVSETLSAMERESVPAGERYDTAVRQLGSPRAARRAYRRQWLTRAEARSFRTFQRRVDADLKPCLGLRVAEWLWLLAAVLIMVPTVLVFGFGFGQVVIGAFCFGLMVNALAAPVGRAVVRRYGEQWAFPLFAGSELINLLGITLWWGCVAFAVSLNGFDYSFFVLPGLMLLLGAIRLDVSFRIWRKLYAGNGPDGHA